MKRLMMLGLLGALPVFAAFAHGQESDYEGDVNDLRVIRRVEQHPHAWRIWQPFIIQGDKKKDLLVAFGVQVNGKNDMGDILVSLSKDDGDTWEEPVLIFDHRERQGANVNRAGIKWQAQQPEQQASHSLSPS